MRRPVIGIATQTQAAIPGELPAVWIMGQKYVRALTRAGAVPWIIPLLDEDEDTLRAIYDRLDGVLLAGGLDVDPSQYGEARLACCDKSDAARDAVERRLVEWSVAGRKPLLGVCRGIQMINVALGGSLYQDIRTQRPDAIRHDYFSSESGHGRDYLAHPVTIEPHSRLAEAMQAGELAVNSMHHQGVARLAPGLKATAFAPDGLIEGFEGTDGHFLLAVQWHPEELAEASAPMARLFSAFVEAARA